MTVFNFGWKFTLTYEPKECQNINESDRKEIRSIKPISQYSEGTKVSRWIHRASSYTPFPLKPPPPSFLLGPSYISLSFDCSCNHKFVFCHRFGWKWCIWSRDQSRSNRVAQRGRKDADVFRCVLIMACNFHSGDQTFKIHQYKHLVQCSLSGLWAGIN